MYSKMLHLTVFLFAFSSFILVGSVISPNSVLASTDQDIDQDPSYEDPYHFDIQKNQGQCLKDHKDYDKDGRDRHCK
ncbi:MAG TPA: hypothetical protein VJU13_01540 [Candidatus Nitrosocosmicus sp.]|nr:hypothetical protein [Candidatus Nitrosocosmicus sp.]